MKSVMWLGVSIYTLRAHRNGGPVWLLIDYTVEFVVQVGFLK